MNKVGKDEGMKREGRWKEKLLSSCVWLPLRRVCVVVMQSEGGV